MLLLAIKTLKRLTTYYVCNKSISSSSRTQSKIKFNIHRHIIWYLVYDHDKTTKKKNLSAFLIHIEFLFFSFFKFVFLVRNSWQCVLKILFQIFSLKTACTTHNTWNIIIHHLYHKSKFIRNSRPCVFVCDVHICDTLFTWLHGSSLIINKFYFSSILRVRWWRFFFGVHMYKGILLYGHWFMHVRRH